MGIFDNITRLFTKKDGKEANVNKTPVKNTIGEKKIDFGKFNSYGIPDQYPDYSTNEALQRYEGWVYACVKKISTTAAAVELKLYEQKSTGVEEIQKHELLDVLNRANDFMTYYDMIELTTMFLELTGEAYWWKVRDERGKVIELFPWFLPSGMTIIPGKDKFISGYVYRVPETGQEIPFDSEDIIYFRFPSPTNRFRGMSPVKASAMDVETERNARWWNLKFFKNSARPYGALKTEHKLDQETYDRLKMQWEAQHQGGNNAYKVAILEQGLDFAEIAMSHTDMDFINQRTFSRDSILSMFGVPKSVLGIVEDVNRANAEVSKEVFLTETIEPLMRKIVGSINEQLVTSEFQDNYFLDFDDLTSEDQETVLARYKAGIADGWLSRNEVRLSEGLSTVEGADILTMPLNQVPLGEADSTSKGLKTHFAPRYKTEHDIINEVVEETIDKKIHKKKIAKQANKAIGKSPACRQADETQEECVARKIPEIMKEDPSMENDQATAVAISLCKRPCSAKSKKKIEGGLSENQKLKFWQMKDAFVNVGITKVKKELQTELRKQRAYVLKQFDNKAFSKEDIKRILLPVALFSGKLKDRLFPTMVGLTITHGDAVSRAFKLGEEISDKTAQSFISRRLKKSADSIVKNNNDLIAETLQQGLKDGDIIPDLRKRITNLFDNRIIKDKAELIARTETTASSTFASEQIYKQAGITQKEWLVNPGACPMCTPLNGKKVYIDAPFFEKGDIVVGANGNRLTVDFETISRPPLHVNCRCDLLPVI